MKKQFSQDSQCFRFGKFCCFAILAYSIVSIGARTKDTEPFVGPLSPKSLTIRDPFLAQIIQINPLNPAIPLQLRINGRVPAANQAPQLAPGQPSNDENGVSGGIGLSTNRAMMMKLERAKKLTVEKKYSEAITLYEDILKTPSDFFFKPDPQKPFHKSIKAEARQILGTLPDEGRDAYAMSYNIVAQKMLDEALASGDMDQLSNISRVYFYTPAGKQATWIYGRYCLDHNQPLAAAMSFQTLYDLSKAEKSVDQSLSMILALAWYRNGMNERAMPLLEELRSNLPEGLDWNDKKISWYENPQQLDQWMATVFGERHYGFVNAAQSWGMFRGNLSRNLIGGTTIPLLSSKWNIDFEKDSKSQEAQATLIEKEFRVESKSSLPTTQPLAVGNLILLEKADEIVGVNFETGERVWQYPPAISANTRISDQAIQNELNVAARRMIQWQQINNSSPASTPPPTSKLTLSADNQQAYVVENLDVALFGSQLPVATRSRSAVQQSNNILSALDLKKEGYLKWQVGGRTGEAEPKLASVFFQGAPLPLNNQLYILGEIGNEMSLFCLDAETGHLLWSQSLYVYERSLAQDFERKKINLVPSYSDGIMVCPTLSGNVIAVDLFNRTLLWAQNYEAPPEESEFNQRAARFGQASRFQAPRQHWTDTVATITQGKVLLSPPDLDALVCIDLFSGAINWKLDKSDTRDQAPLYLAGTENGIAMIVDKSMVYGLRVEDKSIAWKVAYGAPSPSGRGYMSKGHYYLPLSSAEVWKIEFKTGKVVARSKSRDGSVPGNLIAYNGHVLSMNEKSLSCYHSLDDRQKWATQALETNPNDADALFAMGEIQLCDAKLNEAITSLEKAWEISKKNNIRTTLSEALIQRLQNNFAANTQSIPQIKELLNNSPAGDDFSALLIKNYLKEGKRADALNEILTVGNSSFRNDFEEIEPGKLMMRQDRWLLTVVDDLRKTSPADEWQTFRTKLEAVAKMNPSQGTQQMWRDILSSIDPSTISSDWHQSQIDEHLSKKDYLRAELSMLAMRESDSSKTSAQGLNNLIRLNQQLGRTNDLLTLIDDLRFSVPDQTIRDEKNGITLANELLEQDQLASLVRGPSNWPRGNIKHSVVPRTVTRYSYPIEIQPDRGGTSNDVRLYYDSSSTYEITAVDGKGNTLFTIPIREMMSGRPDANQSEQYQARFVGHMLIISLAKSIAAFDTLSITNEKPKLLWKRDFSSLIGDEFSVLRNDGFAPAMPGKRRNLSRDQNGNITAICNTWLVCNEIVFVQRNSKLLAFDSYSGEILWIRQDTKLASDIACDGKKVCLLMENGREAQVYDARNGIRLEPITLPVGDRHFIRGMKLLYSAVANAKREVHLFDLDTQKNIWTVQTTSAVASISRIDDREVAIFDQRGFLYIVDFETGKGPKSLNTGDQPFKSYLRPETSPQLVEVKRDFDRYYAVVGHHSINQNGRSFGVTMNGYRSIQAISGWVYAIDRKKGTQSWEHPLTDTSFPNLQSSANPLLIFGVNLSETSNGNYEQHFRYTLLDKKTGKLIANDRTTSAIQLQVNIDDEKKQVNILTNTGTIQVTFNDSQKVISAPGDSPKEAEKTTSQPK